MDGSDSCTNRSTYMRVSCFPFMPSADLDQMVLPCNLGMASSFHASQSRWPALACKSQCFNFLRQLFGMTLGFYSIPFGDKIGYHLSFTLFAIVCVITFLPILALMRWGGTWRK
ncbi:hypothetical protein AB1N83_004686 [Pleurotus pulmonarius]